ncbi:MAG: hypothetical protein V4667_05220 [Bacteroidota bacterium]
MKNFIFNLIFLFSILAFFSCKKEEQSAVISFDTPVKATISGYTGNIMEPFITKDDKILFFNNLNSQPENTNLHWALKINDTLFSYQGEIANVNSPEIEGVASMDANNNFYYVSTNNYASTLKSLYYAEFNNGTLSNNTTIENIAKEKNYWINFDAEITNDGNQLFYVEAKMDSKAIPVKADIFIAKKNNTNFEKIESSSKTLATVNTNELEYAPCISSNYLELFFTRLKTPINSNSKPQIYYCTRKTTDAPFGKAVLIENFDGFVEAPTLTNDGKTIYYHKHVDGKFSLFMSKRK